MEIVCRAFTFINYHIPPRWGKGSRSPYTTLGYFDGLFTEALELNYARQDLKALWRYTLKRTEESTGVFSYQNIFGFGEDGWNSWSDGEFWSEKADHDYPLIFISFIQMEGYLNGKGCIYDQCQEFHGLLDCEIAQEGMRYVYTTVDKNDFIVCIRCRKHSVALRAIKNMHKAKKGVVYSYSTLSVKNDVLNRLSNGEYLDMYNEMIDSICLKGITNSHSFGRRIPLDQKYTQFCNKLISCLEYNGKVPENVTYDILGDDDFRLIARNVSLGRLLEQFGEQGCFGSLEGDLSLCLYTSSLILNTKNQNEFGVLSPSEVAVAKKFRDMEQERAAGKCEELAERMQKIRQAFRLGEGTIQDEKKATFCQAVWQLLQSLKVLEAAPTKSYDFDSLYRPFAMLIDILESKLDDPDVAENSRIYEFIHKISTVLHGTLRNDIQFFQIRDFNAIVHYAPAKLRAFYALWALKLSDFYNNMSTEHHKYAFVLAPGLFGETRVSQLYTDYQEQNRLMLITIPERHLYSIGLLSIILAHETSHFAGSTLRNRGRRHKAWLDSLARVMQLEFCSYVYQTAGSRMQNLIQRYFKETQGEGCPDNFGGEIIKWVEEEERPKRTEGQKGDYHFQNSKRILLEAYNEAIANNLDVLAAKFRAGIQRYLVDRCKEEYPSKTERLENIKDISAECYGWEKGLCLLADNINKLQIDELLDFLAYFYTETFADVMAILTLQLKATDYLESFLKNEQHEIDVEKKNVPMVIVRITLVMQGINKAVNENPAWEKKLPDFTKHWRGNWMNALIDAYPVGSQELKMVCQINKYRKHRLLHECLEQYKGLYDVRTQSFTGGQLSFMADETIIGYLLDYLTVCADDYIERLVSEEKLFKEQKDIDRIYSIISGESPMDMSQEIEDMLAFYGNCDIINE